MSDRTPVLVLIQGDEPGARWKLQETRVTTIGRSSRNQISLVSPTVSRYHCEVSCINGLWHIADLNSKKGTYVNGRRITQREVLKPGDVVRLSTNVFRFDLVDEDAEDEAFAALRDVGEDAEATDHAELPEAIEQIRRRSQLSAAEREERRRTRRKVLQNALFIGSVAVVVTLVVGTALAKAHAVEGRKREQKEQRREDARQAYDEAQALAQSGPGGRLEALLTLSKIGRDYADTDAAQDAAELCRQMEGSVLEDGLGRIQTAETEGDYTGALDRTKLLMSVLSDPALRNFLATGLEHTEELARVAFREIEQEATRLEEDEGDHEGAIALYAQATTRIGLPEVVRAANARIEEIRERHSLPPRPSPEPERAPEPENERKPPVRPDEEEKGGDGYPDMEELEEDFKRPVDLDLK